MPLSFLRESTRTPSDSPCPYEEAKRNAINE